MVYDAAFTTLVRGFKKRNNTKKNGIERIAKIKLRYHPKQKIAYARKSEKKVRKTRTTQYKVIKLQTCNKPVCRVKAGQKKAHNKGNLIHAAGCPRQIQTDWWELSCSGGTLMAQGLTSSSSAYWQASKIINVLLDFWLAALGLWLTQKFLRTILHATNYQRKRNKFITRSTLMPHRITWHFYWQVLNLLTFTDDVSMCTLICVCVATHASLLSVDPHRKYF